MPNYRISILCLLFLAGCASTKISDPIASAPTDNGTIRWAGQDKITQCQPNTINEIELVLHKNGTWHCKLQMKNTDRYRYRSLWNNRVSLALHTRLEQQPLATLEILNEPIRSFSVETYERSGQWDNKRIDYSSLKPALIKVVHGCEGIEE